MEDLKASVAPSAHRLPLVAEIIMFENNLYITEEALTSKISSLQRLYQASKTLFVLKLSGKLAPNLATLNEKILFAFGLLKRNEPVLVELSYERMKILSSLSDSCFLHPRIYPSLKYYIRQGDEENAQSEIFELLKSLKEFAGIKIVVSISIQKPWPNLTPLLNLLRKDFVGLVRLIELTLERSPSVMVESVQRVIERRKKEEADMALTVTPSKSSKRKKDSPEEYHPLQLGSDSSDDEEIVVEPKPPQISGPMEFSALDPFELIMHLRETSMGELDEDDFQPISISSALEPFLELVGIGKFSIRPTSHCGFSACFFSTETISSASISKYIDLQKFNELMKPLLPSIREKGIGFFTARSIKKVIKSSAKVKLPDLVSYMADSSKASMVNEFVEKLQFLVIHNHMDVASVDMSRRCDCSVLSLDQNGLVASCTGCL
jgi:hypothetical protein